MKHWNPRMTALYTHFRTLLGPSASLETLTS